MICPYCQHENIGGTDECANCGGALSGLDLPGGTKTAGPAFIHEPLERLPQRGIETVSVSDPVALAVRRMQTGNTGAVLVMDGERLAGIITGNNLLKSIAAPRADHNAVTCGQIMTPDPIVFHYDDSIALAINKMAAGEFRHIPIVHNDRPVNVIDVNDVFCFIAPHLL